MKQLGSASPAKQGARAAGRREKLPLPIMQFSRCAPALRLGHKDPRKAASMRNKTRPNTTTGLEAAWVVLAASPGQRVGLRLTSRHVCLGKCVRRVRVQHGSLSNCRVSGHNHLHRGHWLGGVPRRRRTGRGASAGHPPSCSCCCHLAAPALEPERARRHLPSLAVTVREKSLVLCAGRGLEQGAEPRCGQFWPLPGSLTTLPLPLVTDSLGSRPQHRHPLPVRLAPLTKTATRRLRPRWNFVPFVQLGRCDSRLRRS